MGILVCQAMFGIEAGEEVQAMIEDATGLPCPCVRGEHCPLARPETPTLMPMPRLRAV